MEVLQNCPLFSGFTGAQICALLENSGGLRRKLKKGERLPEHRLGLLLSGALSIKGQAVDSREFELNHILPGAAFGAASLFLQGTTLSSIFAEKNSEVFLLDADQVWALMDASSRFRSNYIVFLCGRIAFLNKKIESLSGYTAESRLLAYLQQEQQEGEVQIASFRALAGALGISRASLYRAMDALAAAGQLQRLGNRLVLTGDSPDEQPLCTAF